MMDHDVIDIRPTLSALKCSSSSLCIARLYNLYQYDIFGYPLFKLRGANRLYCT